MPELDGSLTVEPNWHMNPGMRDEALFQRLVTALGDPMLDQEDETFLRWVSAWSEPTVNRLCDLIERGLACRGQVTRLRRNEPDLPGAPTS